METPVQNSEHMKAPTRLTDTHPRPRASRNRTATTHRINLCAGIESSLDAQAACDFTRLASKHSPFFQSVNEIAAILRAKVRRAISGFIPLASKPL